MLKGAMAEVALVTGAAGALGSVVARTLATRGCNVVLVDAERHKRALQDLAGSLGGACVVAGDVASEAMWAVATSRIERELGAAPSLAALIAGGWAGGMPLFEEANDEVWRSMLAANLETAYQSLRALLPSMVKGRHGSVVVIGSRAVEQPGTSARAAAYAASKAAVVALARASAAEVLEHGVRINAILPSTLDTPANRTTMPQADASRWVTLESAAGVVAFLLSDDARDVSGAAIPLYGRA
ncbi:MAG: SDR family NAD(P)-dependent oxidoreductase [Myxococcota bacterium]|nr:SDR family NAD(P)-dependent oxidoreductase [Myxococcota bacterium]